MTTRLSFTGAEWAIGAPHADASLLTDVPQTVDALTAQFASLRWGQARATDSDWLHPALEHLHDPYAMLGMTHAVERLKKAVRDKEHIRIITDYDVDGTTSSLILQAALGIVGQGCQIDFHIPDRFTEGYGFSVHAAKQAAADGVDLIVTADIGIRDQNAVHAARDGGSEVLICDHHLPSGAEVPQDALVLCPPQKGCTYPNPHLAACGVSLKLAQALLAEHPRLDALVRSLLKLAAIGTVADMVPLTTLENRAIVRLGLDSLNSGNHSPGLDALLRVADLTPGTIDETDLGFRIGPRINAAGRIADASIVVDLLSCRDHGIADRLASRVDQMNTERKGVQNRLVKQVLAALPQTPDPFVLVAGPEHEGWHRGVVGIVASKVKEEVHRPVGIISIQGEYATGSVRSVPEVHAVQALEGAADLLVKFGGHPGAAGFTVRAKDIDALRERLCEVVEQRSQGSLTAPVRAYDLDVPQELLSPQLHRALRALAPFGMGNPKPVFLLSHLNAQRPRLLSNGQHLKFHMTDSSRAIECLWWGHGEWLPKITEGPIDILATVGLNRWRGKETLQLIVQDVRPSNSAG